MTWEGFAMFVHVGSAIVGLMMAAVLHTALIQTSRAESVEQMRPWVPVIRRLEPLLPLAALVLFGSGAWLIAISGGEFHWGDGWIVTGIVSLVVAESVGAALAPHSKAFQAAISSAPDGAVAADLRRRSLDPVMWFGAHFATAVFIGVVFIMSAQPPALTSILAVVIAAAIGIATAVPAVRRRPQEAATVAAVVPEPVASGLTSGAESADGRGPR